MEIKEREFREFAKKKVKELQKEIDKWNKVLDAFGIAEAEQAEEIEAVTIKPIEKTGFQKIVRTQQRLTVNQMVVNALNEALTPLTSRDIMNMLNEKYGKDYKLDNFSGAFSSMYRKPNSGILQYNMVNPTLEVKAVYGLDSWFDEEGNLRHEYKEKLEERYGNY